MSAAELYGVSRVWQNLKTTLQQRTSEVEALKGQLQVLMVKYDSLQESSSQSEFHMRQQVEASLVEVSKAQMQVQAVQQEKKELQHHVSHFEMETQTLERRLQVKTQECEEQTQRVEDLKQRVIAIENKSAVVIGKTLVDQKELRSLQQRHAELEQVHSNLQELHEATHRQLGDAKARLGRTRESAQHEAAGRRHASQQSERLESQVRQLLADNKLLAGRLEQALVKLGRRRVDRAHLQRQAAELNELADKIDAARQQSRGDVERARADARRLLTILGDFYGQGKDLTAGLEDHTFVRRKQAFMEEFQGLCERYAPVDLSDGHILQDDELNYWIPQQALELAGAFQALHLPAVKTELLESLLLSLHSVWRMRERILCEKLFRNYQTKIAVLKRQIVQRKPYQEVVLSDRNQFLKAEIRRLRNALMDAQRFPTDGVAQKVEQSVALAEVMADKLAASQREVEALKMRLYAAGEDVDPQVATTAAHSHSRLSGSAFGQGGSGGGGIENGAAAKQRQARGLAAALMTPDRRRQHELEQSVSQQMRNSRLYGGTGRVGDTRGGGGSGGGGGGGDATHGGGRHHFDDDLDDDSDEGGIFDDLNTRLASIRKKVDVYHQQPQATGAAAAGGSGRR